MAENTPRCGVVLSVKYEEEPLQNKREAAEDAARNTRASADATHNPKKKMKSSCDFMDDGPDDIGNPVNFRTIPDLNLIGEGATDEEMTADEAAPNTGAQKETDQQKEIEESRPNFVSFDNEPFRLTGQEKLDVILEMVKNQRTAVKMMDETIDKLQQRIYAQERWLIEGETFMRNAVSVQASAYGRGLAWVGKRIIMFVTELAKNGRLSKEGVAALRGMDDGINRLLQDIQKHQIPEEEYASIRHLIVAFKQAAQMRKDEAEKHGNIGSGPSYHPPK